MPAIQVEQWTAHEALLLLTIFFFISFGIFAGLGFVCARIWERIKRQ